MNTLSRRNFLKLSGSALGSGMLSACGSSTNAGTPSLGSGIATPGGPLQIKPQNKALVFILLAGGNDSFNMLVPTTAAAYRAYQQSRTNLALDKSDLLALNGFTDAGGTQFGLHPSMTKVQQLFQQKKLSFIANCGPLVKPTSKTDFQNSTDLPIGLMSHADQIRHWQTATPNQRGKYGWFGRYADHLQANKSNEQLAMNISLSGSNTLQNGQDTVAYSIESQGSVGLVVKEKDPTFSPGQQALNNALLGSINTMLDTRYHDPFMQTYVGMMQHAQAYHEQFQKAVGGVQSHTAFSDTSLSKQLNMVARTIAASEALGLPQQTFFIEYLGWDHHDELLNNHSRMLKILSDGLGEFDAALQALKVANKTITFTGSDFGRTLTSNGNGTDHGWGGNIMVMGDAIDGGKVFGEYPSLALNNKRDAGDGVLIPTTSTDEIFAELSMWFGVERTSLNTLFPNLGNFYNTQSQASPLGFIT